MAADMAVRPKPQGTATPGLPAFIIINRKGEAMPVSHGAIPPKDLPEGCVWAPFTKPDGTLLKPRQFRGTHAYLMLDYEFKIIAHREYRAYCELPSTDNTTHHGAPGNVGGVTLG